MKREESRHLAGRLLRWVLFPVVGMVILGFVGSNLILQSAWFRGRVGGKLAGETRLSWTIAEASWSPWGGVRLGGLKAEAVYSGEGSIPPICEIEEVRARPYWRALLSGRLEFREIRVKSPRGKVPVELLAQLMAPDGRVDVARLRVPESTGDSVAGPEEGPGSRDMEPRPAKDPDPGDDHPPGLAKQGLGPTDQEGEGKKSSGKATAKKKSPGEGGKEAVGSPPASVPRERSARLIVEDGELQVYRLADPERAFVISGIGGEVPFAGEELVGWLESSGVRWGDHKLLSGMKIPVQWQKPVLRIAPVEMLWNGLRFRALAAMRIRGRVTGNVEIRGFPGPLKQVNAPGWPSVKVAAEQVEMLARWQGELTRPGTWVGNLVGVASGLRGRHADRGEPLVFDDGRVVMDLRGGVVQVVDVRLVGERLSLMGNGLALMDGRSVGVLRVVADPEYAEKMTKVAVGSLLSSGQTSSWLAPLETPDRYYRDTHLQGAFPTYLIDVGRKREQVEVRQAWQWLAAFVQREQKEEHQGELSAPGPDERTGEPREGGIGS